jgi:micrococcal nuclease
MKKIFIFLLLFPSILFAQDFYLCTGVVNGDTIVIRINNKKEKVRLIGVNTPKTALKTEYFGKDALAFTKRMAEGEMVRLEYDVVKRDKYGKLLAYVYLEDGTFLNEVLVKQGYGYTDTKNPFKYLDEFRQYEREARKNIRGLWANKEESFIEEFKSSIIEIDNGRIQVEERIMESKGKEFKQFKILLTHFAVTTHAFCKAVEIYKHSRVRSCAHINQGNSVSLGRTHEKLLGSSLTILLTNDSSIRPGECIVKCIYIEHGMPKDFTY